MREFFEKAWAWMKKNFKDIIREIIEVLDLLYCLGMTLRRMKRAWDF